VQTVDIRFNCTEAAFAPAAKVVLPWPVQGALIVVRAAGVERSNYIERRDGAVRLPLADLRVASEPWTELGLRYLMLGIEHILSGIDHLALVLCLCLLARGWHLAGLVTAFILGHSVALSLGVLGWVHVSAIPLEVCIALSIAFLAREVLRPSPAGHGFWLIVAFGLLHGLGFASALSAVGVPKGALLLGLGAFNLGVEIGQLLFVAAFLSLLAVVRYVLHATAAWRDIGRQALAASVGAVAMYWTIDRASVLVG
jgi:hypothetical protein